MDQRSTTAVFNAIVLALVFMLIAGAIGFVYLRSNGALAAPASTDRVVIVMASTGEDGAELAGLVAVATNGGANVEVLDPLKAVTIQGTSYDKLRDAYPFGGAKAVAAALGAKAGDGTGWVDVPESVWVAALEQDGSVNASGVPGVQVTLPKPIDVFDGQRLASFPEGTVTVEAGDVPMLLRGVAYLPEPARVAVVEPVGRAVLSALARRGTDGITSNLSPEALAALLQRFKLR